MALPYGIQISVVNDGGLVTSTLGEEGRLFAASDSPTDKAQAKGFADGVESLLLALACAGVEVETPVFAEAIQSAVDGFMNAREAMDEVPGMAEVAKALAGALGGCVDQIDQMKGMFDDSDGAIEQSLNDAAEALDGFRKTV